jgi:hypothetical protein
LGAQLRQHQASRHAPLRMGGVTAGKKPHGVLRRETALRGVGFWVAGDF